MKKLSKITSIVLLNSFACINLAQAQTCSAPPSCAALGYDKSTSDCSGQAILRCPFDQAKVFCMGTMPEIGNGGGGDNNNYESGFCTGKCIKTKDGKIWKLSETKIEVTDENGFDPEKACRELKEDKRLWQALRCSANNDEFAYHGNLFAPWIAEPTLCLFNYSTVDVSICRYICKDYHCYTAMSFIRNGSFIHDTYNNLYAEKGERVPCPEEKMYIRCVSEYFQQKYRSSYSPTSSLTGLLSTA